MADLAVEWAAMAAVGMELRLGMGLDSGSLAHLPRGRRREAGRGGAPTLREREELRRPMEGGSAEPKQRGGERDFIWFFI